MPLLFPSFFRVVCLLFFPSSNMPIFPSLLHNSLTHTLCSVRICSMFSALKSYRSISKWISIFTPLLRNVLTCFIHVACSGFNAFLLNQCVHIVCVFLPSCCCYCCLWSACFAWDSNALINAYNPYSSAQVPVPEGSSKNKLWDVINFLSFIRKLSISQVWQQNGVDLIFKLRSVWATNRGKWLNV